MLLASWVICSFQSRATAQTCEQIFKQTTYSVTQAGELLASQGVSFSNVTRQQLTSLQIYAASAHSPAWAKTAVGMARVFQKPVEVDRYILADGSEVELAAKQYGELSRILLSPTMVSREIEAQAALHHEAVHETTDAQFLINGASPRSHWLTRFKFIGPRESKLDDIYKSDFRVDEILAYQKTIRYWQQIAQKTQARSTPQQIVTNEFAIAKAVHAQEQLLEFFSETETLLTAVIREINSSIVEVGALDLERMSPFNKRLSNRHYLLTIRIHDVRGVTSIMVPYFTEMVVTAQTPVKIQFDQIQQRLELLLQQLRDEKIAVASSRAAQPIL